MNKTIEEFRNKLYKLKTKDKVKGFLMLFISVFLISLSFNISYLYFSDFIDEYKNHIEFARAVIVVFIPILFFIFFVEKKSKNIQ